MNKNRKAEYELYHGMAQNPEGLYKNKGGFPKVVSLYKKEKVESFNY